MAEAQSNRDGQVRHERLGDEHARRRVERLATLNQMTKEASEVGLYDESADAYAAALRKVRSRRGRTRESTRTGFSA